MRYAMVCLAALVLAAGLTGCMHKGSEAMELDLGSPAGGADTVGFNWAPASSTDEGGAITAGVTLRGAAASPPPAPAKTPAKAAPRRRYEAEGIRRTANASTQAALVSDVPQMGRLIIYNASMTMVVPDIASTLDAIKAAAEKAGGYMQSLHGQSIQVKVPAEKFHDTIAAFEKLGEVTGKEVNGSDVTDQMRDLRIRLKNAEQMRERLVALLDRATKVEDALKIEQELGRVTETIELLKGEINALEHQVTFSTITVSLNSPLPQGQMKEEIPFPWVRTLGGSIAKGSDGLPPMVIERKGIRFDLPKGFALYHRTRDFTAATSADGVMVRVLRHDSAEGADLEFWTTLTKRSLTATHLIVVDDESETTLARGETACVLEGTKAIAGKKFTYMVALVLYKDTVYSYEAWGPCDRFADVKEAIERSMQTLDVR